MEYFELANGLMMPAVGLGTFPMDNEGTQAAVRTASRLGYELFDTSTSYGNEKGVGRGRRRTDFITTKVANTDQRGSTVRRACFKSCLRLRTTRIDLYLLHWPQPGCFQDSWRVLEELYSEGRCKAIGVANFHIHHLEELFQTCSIRPMVNQVELHPLLTQKGLADFCRQNGIVCEAYSPFARMDAKVVQNSTLRRIADGHEKMTTQVILRWNYQNGIVSIPKTSSAERMSSNIDIFDFALSDEEMRDIDALDEGYRVRHNPDTCDYDAL